jgi:hypothetical protein
VAVLCDLGEISREIVFFDVAITASDNRGSARLREKLVPDE